MKKIGLSFATILMSISLAFSQPVSDMGIIPIGVTLNSILRLNIVKGGNIEFVVNTVEQYTNGIANSPLYTTSFNVSSSIDFNIRMYAETGTFISTDDATNAPTNPMALNNLGYTVAYAGTGGAVNTNWNIPTITAGVPSALENVGGVNITIIQGIDNAAAGDIIKNAFDIEWELGTAVLTSSMNPNSLLFESYAADRYVVNVLLVLESN